MYEVPEMRDACFDVLLKSVTDSTALLLWNCAHRYNADAAAEKCRQLCVQNFKVNKTGFLMCDRDVIVQLLSHHALNVQSESDVFVSLVEWIMYKRDDRWRYLQEMFDKCIRTEFVECESALLKLRHMPFTDAEKAQLYDILSRTTSGDIRGTILAPRISTERIQCLMVCVYTDEKVVEIR